MSYTHTSIPVELTEQAFCDDCGNPLPAGAVARRRVTDAGAPVFREEWICGGTCGPIIDDVSDHALMRKRIAELEQEVSRARHDREFALELAQQSADEANLVIVMLESQRDELRVEWERIADTQEELERKMRARLVREVEFVRAVRDLALSPNRVSERYAVINMLISMTTSAMTAIEQDDAPEHPTQARVRELEAELNEAQQERDEIDAELARERAAHLQTAANLNAQLLPARGPRAHIVMDEDQ